MLIPNDLLDLYNSTAAEIREARCVERASPNEDLIVYLIERIARAEIKLYLQEKT